MTPRLSRSAFELLVSNVGGAALSFLLSALTGRALGQEGLGVYAVVMAWVFPLSLVVEFGLATLATRDVAQDTSLSAPYMDAMARARLLLGGILMALLIVVAPLLSSDPLVSTGLIVSAPLVVILPFYSSFTAVFKAQGGMWTIPPLNLGMLGAQVILTALVFLNGGGVLAALVVNVLTSAGQLVAAYALYRWKFYVLSAASKNSLESESSSPPSEPLCLRAVWGRRKRAKPQSSEAKSAQWGVIPLLRRALPFALAALFAALQTRVSLILLESLATTADVGYYAAASRFVEATRLFPNAFFGALFPALSALAAQPVVLNRTFRRALFGLTAFGLLAVAAALLLGAWAVTLVFGSAFAPAIPALYVLMGSLFFSLLRGGRTLYWYALGREAQVNAVNGLVVVLQIVLSAWLIPQRGALGAAWGVLAAEAVALALLWRELRLPRVQSRRLNTEKQRDRATEKLSS